MFSIVTYYVFLCGCSSIRSSLDKCRCIYLGSFYKTLISKKKCNQYSASLQNLRFSPSSQCFPQVRIKCFKLCIQVEMELSCLKKTPGFNWNRRGFLVVVLSTSLDMQFPRYWSSLGADRRPFLWASDSSFLDFPHSYFLQGEKSISSSVCLLGGVGFGVGFLLFSFGVSWGVGFLCVCFVVGGFSLFFLLLFLFGFWWFFSWLKNISSFGKDCGVSYLDFFF